MWVADWLFGPRKLAPYDGRIETRSLTLEPDTVREIFRMAERLGAAELRITDNDGDGDLGTLDIDDLESAPDWERSQLRLMAGRMVPGGGGQTVLGSLVDVDLRRNICSAVNFHRFDPASGDPAPAVDPARLAHEIADKLIRDGRPRVRWRPVSWVLPYAVPLLLVGCWVWFCWADRPPLSLGLVGLLLLPVTWMVAYYTAGLVRQRQPNPWPGNRIRTVSRADLRVERANRHASLKLAAYTVPLGAVAGGLAQWYFTR